VTPDSIKVLIVDDHEELAKGVQATLSSADDMIVVDILDRVPDPRERGLRFDLCVLDLMGHATAERLTAFLASAPAMVYSVETRWQQRVAAWVCGARSVLGKDVAGGTLIGAVRDAVRRPHALSPQLADALSKAIEEYRLPAPTYLPEALASFAYSWRELDDVLRSQGIDERRWNADLEALRAVCVERELGRLEVSGPVAELTHSSGAVPIPQTRKLPGRQRECLEHRADGLSVPEIADRLHISVETVKTHLEKALARFGIRKNDSETTMVFALYVMGRHRHPERLHGQLSRIRREWPVEDPKEPPLPL
jgi:DNA-binding NarL/FixJ family response regulator